MPRPKVERTPRLIRLPAEVDAGLVREAEAHGKSINEVYEAAARFWLAGRPKPRSAPATSEAPPKAISRKRQVEPRFKGKGKT